jgi:hypothetical protein
VRRRGLVRIDLLVRLVLFRGVGGANRKGTGIETTSIERVLALYNATNTVFRHCLMPHYFPNASLSQLEAYTGIRAVHF